jgi:hypothetical protein
MAVAVVNTPVVGVVAPTVPLSGPENAVAVNFVPSNVKLSEPANVPALLY